MRVETIAEAYGKGAFDYTTPKSGDLWPRGLLSRKYQDSVEKKVK